MYDKALFLVSMDRGLIKKEFVLVWSQCRGIMIRGPFGRRRSMRAARMVVGAYTNIVSAARSIDEEGRRLYISCAGHFSFLAEGSSIYLE